MHKTPSLTTFFNPEKSLHPFRDIFLKHQNFIEIDTISDSVVHKIRQLKVSNYSKCPSFGNISERSF